MSSGVPNTVDFLFRIGLVMLALAAFIGWLATRAVPPAPLVWLVIAGNIAWLVQSTVLLGQVGPSLTGLCIALTAAQAAFVSLMGVLEYAGLKRSGALAA